MRHRLYFQLSYIMNFKKIIYPAISLPVLIFFLCFFTIFIPSEHAHAQNPGPVADTGPRADTNLGHDTSSTGAEYSQLKRIDQLYRSGKYRQAAELLEQRRDVGRITPNQLAFLALCYLQLEDLSAAKEALTISERLAPDGYLFLIAKGNLHMLKGEYALAQTMFEKAHTLYPQQSGPRAGIVQAEYAHALQHLQERDYEKAADLLVHAHSLQPDNSRIMSARIAALKHTSRKDELLNVYHRFIEINPHYPDAYAGLGTLLWEENQREKAFRYLEKAVELDSQDPMPFYILGRRASDKDNAQAARSLLKEAIGKAVYLYGRYQVEVAEQLKANKSHVSSAAASSSVTAAEQDASSSFSQNAAEAEAARIEKLRELSRSSEQPKQIILNSLELLTELYDNEKKLRSDLETLSRWYPNSMEIRAHLAEHYYEAGLIDTALQTWEELSEQFPFNSDVHVGIGRCYQALDNFSYALRAFRRALDLSPEDPQVYAELEHLLNQTGSHEEYLVLLKRRLLRDRYNIQLLQEAIHAARKEGEIKTAEKYQRRIDQIQKSQ